MRRLLLPLLLLTAGLASGCERSAPYSGEEASTGSSGESGAAPALTAIPAGAGCELPVGRPALTRQGGNGAGCLLEGWSTPEEGGTWSEASTAQLALRLGAKPTTAAVIELTLMPFTAPSLPSQAVTASVGANTVGQFQVGKGSPPAQQVRLEPSVVGPQGEVLLNLALPNATAPQALGVNADERTLGVFLSSVRRLQ